MMTQGERAAIDAVWNSHGSTYMGRAATEAFELLLDERIPEGPFHALQVIAARTPTGPPAAR
jgi:hypothetical protein